MHSSPWKCYRCDLLFRDADHAGMHKDISGHSVTKLRAAAGQQPALPRRLDRPPEAGAAAGR